MGLAEGSAVIHRDALAPLLDDRGRFTVLAIDHRDSLRVEFSRDDPAGVPLETLVQFKLDVIEAFGERPSAVMLDPELSIDQVLCAGRLPPGVGSLCALEAQGYLDRPEVATNTLLEGWSPQRAKAVGASAAKLLVLYRPDRGAITEAQDDLIRSVVDDCAAVGLPLFVEPVPYDIVDVDDREHTVVASAERIAALGPDVVKMPFPSAADHPERWEAACRRVHEAIDIPWAVLSWGAPFEMFVRQTEVACANGCNGFMAGRAIWGDSVHAPDRAAHLAAVAIPRFEALVAATR
jgi:tagatose 1,6-diphosphate aldolase